MVNFVLTATLAIKKLFKICQIDKNQNSVL